MTEVTTNEPYDIVTLRGELYTLRESFNAFRAATDDRFRHQSYKLDHEVLDSVHRLTDYLRHENFQSLSDEEFEDKVRELLYSEMSMPF